MSRFIVDREATTVWIAARSSLHPIDSATHGLEGWFEAELDDRGALDLDRPASADLVLSIGAVSSGNPLYDREMRRRVDVRRFPEIHAVLRSMRPTGTTGRYEAEGDVTFRGVTRPASDEVKLTVEGGGAVVLEAEHTFDLRDFGMEPPRILMLRVYPDVLVRARIIARSAGREGERPAR